MGNFVYVIWGFAILYTAVKFLRSVQMVPTQWAYIVERLGRYHATLGPGFHVLIPFFDKVAYRLSLKEEAIEVPPQEAFTKDNVKVEVDGVLYLTVRNATNAAYGITDYRFAAIQLVQTTTRSVIGTLDLDRTFEERDAINSRVLSALGEVSEAWGIKVHRYEVKGIVPPASVKNAMERQMGAERERRALTSRSEADKMTRINESEGHKMEAINRSEGEMRARVNEAEGKAAEILAIAKATAESIETIGASLAAEGGSEAAHMRLAQLYISKMAPLARKETEVVLPADLTSITAVLGRVDAALEAVEAPVIARRAPPGAIPAASVLRPPVAREPIPVPARPTDES